MAEPLSVGAGPWAPHLGDLPPTEVGESLQRQRQYIGRPVEREALGGRNFLFAPGGIKKCAV